MARLSEGYSMNRHDKKLAGDLGSAGRIKALREFDVSLTTEQLYKVLASAYVPK